MLFAGHYLEKYPQAVGSRHVFVGNEVLDFSDILSWEGRRSARVDGISW